MEGVPACFEIFGHIVDVIRLIGAVAVYVFVYIVLWIHGSAISPSLSPLQQMKVNITVWI